jgi:hypothetical protein
VSYFRVVLPPDADGRFLRRERSQEKLYAIDPLIARLAHLRNPARPDVDITVLAEMQAWTCGQVRRHWQVAWGCDDGRGIRVGGRADDAQRS